MLGYAREKFEMSHVWRAWRYIHHEWTIKKAIPAGIKLRVKLKLAKT